MNLPNHPRIIILGRKPTICGCIFAGSWFLRWIKGLQKPTIQSDLFVTQNSAVICQKNVSLRQTFLVVFVVIAAFLLTKGDHKYQPLTGQIIHLNHPLQSTVNIPLKSSQSTWEMPCQTKKLPHCQLAAPTIFSGQTPVLGALVVLVLPSAGRVQEPGHQGHQGIGWFLGWVVEDFHNVYRI